MRCRLLLLQVLAGGELPVGAEGQFYPPTVLTGVTPAMRVWKEEVRAAGPPPENAQKMPNMAPVLRPKP